MNVIEWVIWGALVLLVFWAYQAVDLARYWHRPASPKPTRHHVPHWARHGHLPPPAKHGRHARR